MEFESVGKKNLVDEVYKQMRQAIEQKTWTEGDKLPTEHRLAEMFSVSRVVIREALQRLRFEKLIVTRQGSGTFIANPKNFDEASAPGFILSEKEFLDLTEFRSCIEFRSIRLACERGDEKDFQNIRAALSKMRDSIGNNEAFSIADYNFHFAVITAAHNEMFCSAMDSCRGGILHCFYQMNKIVGSHDWGMDIHQATADRIFARDYKGAVDMMKKNSEYNHARLLTYFKATV